METSQKSAVSSPVSTSTSTSTREDQKKKAKMGLEFMFPSLYDGTSIQGRVELPVDVETEDFTRFLSWKPKAAIVAHPYHPLGGSWDDPVVRTVARELLRQGYVVGRFNFRGAGQSQGKTSWTGRGEMGDYTSFCVFMIEFVANLLAEQQQHDGDAKAVTALELLQGTHLVLAGYSYGSMITSNLPSAGLILDLFMKAHRDCDGNEEIEKTMHNFMLRLLHADDKPEGLPHHPELASALSVSYLLVSPILPPVSSFATLSFFRSSPDLTFTSKNGLKIASETLEKKIQNGHRVLAVFGDSDVFCGANKLRAWTAKMKAIDKLRFEECEMEGGSHFWAERKHQDILRGTIKQWVREATRNQPSQSS